MKNEYRANESSLVQLTTNLTLSSTVWIYRDKWSPPAWHQDFESICISSLLSWMGTSDAAIPCCRGRTRYLCEIQSSQTERVLERDFSPICEKDLRRYVNCDLCWHRTLQQRRKNKTVKLTDLIRRDLMCSLKSSCESTSNCFLRKLEMIRLVSSELKRTSVKNCHRHWWVELRAREPLRARFLTDIQHLQ